MKNVVRNITAAAIITLGISVFSACQKDSASTGDTCKTDMAHIAGTYKLTAVKYKASASSPEQDAYNTLLDPCEKDDLVEFKADGSYSYKDAGTTCTPTGNYDGHWGLNGDQLTSDGSSYTSGTISSFDCKTLVYYISNLNANGDKLTLTLTKQ